MISAASRAISARHPKSAISRSYCTHDLGSISAIYLGDISQMRDGSVVVADAYISAMPVDVLKKFIPEKWSTMPYFVQLDELEGIPVINRRINSRINGLIWHRPTCLIRHLPHTAGDQSSAVVRPQARLSRRAMLLALAATFGLCRYVDYVR